MEIKVCPSCGSADIEVAGNKVHCKACDITFKIMPDGAKVDNLDPLGKDHERISALEQEVNELKSRGANEQATNASKKSEEHGDNGFGIEILPDDESDPDFEAEAERRAGD